MRVKHHLFPTSRIDEFNLVPKLSMRVLAAMLGRDEGHFIFLYGEERSLEDTQDLLLRMGFTPLECDEIFEDWKREQLSKTFETRYFRNIIMNEIIQKNRDVWLAEAEAIVKDPPLPPQVLSQKKSSAEP